MESCTRCQQQEAQEANSPLHAYFSALLGNRSIEETTLVQDNSAGVSRQHDRFEIMSRRGECSCYISSASAQRFLSSSATNDSTLALGENRWGSEILDSSSDHSGMDASGVGSSSSGNNRMRLSLDKPKRPPRRRSSPTILLDEADQEKLRAYDNC